MDEKKLIEIITNEIKKILSENRMLKDDRISEISINNRKNIMLIDPDVDTERELSQIFNISNDANDVLVSKISTEDFVNISNGTYSNEKGKKILSFILTGKKVYIIEEGIEYKEYNKIPEKLLKQYKEYQKKIESYGVKIVKKLDLMEYFEEKNSVFSKRVLDIKTLKEIYDGSDKLIEVSKETIITDLAKEFCKSNEIKIKKR